MTSPPRDHIPPAHLTRRMFRVGDHEPDELASCRPAIRLAIVAVLVRNDQVAAIAAALRHRNDMIQRLASGAEDIAANAAAVELAREKVAPSLRAKLSLNAFLLSSGAGHG